MTVSWNVRDLYVAAELFRLAGDSMTVGHGGVAVSPSMFGSLVATVAAECEPATTNAERGLSLAAATGIRDIGHLLEWSAKRYGALEEALVETLDDLRRVVEPTESFGSIFKVQPTVSIEKKEI